MDRMSIQIIIQPPPGVIINVSMSLIKTGLVPSLLRLKNFMAYGLTATNCKDTFMRVVNEKFIHFVFDFGALKSRKTLLSMRSFSRTSYCVRMSNRSYFTYSRETRWLFEIFFYLDWLQFYADTNILRRLKVWHEISSVAKITLTMRNVSNYRLTQHRCVLERFPFLFDLHLVGIFVCAYLTWCYFMAFGTSCGSLLMSFCSCLHWH